jgi:Ca2+/Na+ antiporter
MVAADQAASQTVEDLRDPVQAAAGIMGAVANNRRDALEPRSDERNGRGDVVINNIPRGPLAPIEMEPPRARMRPRHLQVDDAPQVKPHRDSEEFDGGRVRFDVQDHADAANEDIERQEPPRDDEAPPKRKHAEKIVQPIDAPSLGVERMRRQLLAPDAKVFSPNQFVFWVRSLLLLAIGVLFSVVFSEAAVTASSDLSRRTSAHPFYLAFVFFPIAINISELLIAFGVAGRRRRHFTTFAFANLYNSATLNNLIGLGVFCLIVYTQNLGWTFSAETIATLITSCAVGLLASLVRTIPLWVAGPVGLLYIVSLVVFRFLEHYANWT